MSEEVNTTVAEEGTQSTEQQTEVGATEVVTTVVDNKAKFIFRNPKDTPEDKKIQPVELVLPYITMDSLVEALTSGDTKIQQYVIDIVNDRIYDAAEEQVRDDTNPVRTQEALDETKLTLEYLANVTPSARKSSGLSKELWTKFKDTYVELMTKVTDYDVTKLGNQVKMFFARLQPIKTNKIVLAKMAPLVDIWYLKALPDDDAREEFAPIYKYLGEKFTEYSQVTDESIISSLL